MKALLKQTYWRADTPGQLVNKVQRLVELLSPEDGRERTQDLVVEVKKHVKSRSREAENYLFGVCYPLMSDASGYEKHEIHNAMLQAYFGTTAVEVMGQVVTKPVRTTTTNEDGEHEVLSAADYWDFTDFVIREAALWYDLAIPPPDPEKRTR